ncbi:MAG: hypothetical protein GWM88_10560 [Pseudomonadales bacterium]|nr:hypothetical protein [Pseudomonadales bacterium]NIX08409.1 hypothetical protein [Pseudomonadales bacterium]
MWRRPKSWVISACFGLWAASSAAQSDFSVRVKWFGTAAALPEHDLQRNLDGTPAYDQNYDLRLMFREAFSGISLQVEHSTTLVTGDSLNFPSAPGTVLEQSPGGDDRRLMDLTWEIEDGDRHRSFHRLDRLALELQGGDWAFTVGRQAVSWGAGLVFRPMDLFNPFAPTAVDRDYKAGDDLLLIERLFADGSDLEVLAVGRRDEAGDFTGQAGSLAGKWRGFLGGAEVELLAAKHYRDQVYGVGVRYPVKGAMLRSDMVATHLQDGDVRVSGVINLDYSLELAGRLTYVFAEYFHNGFGVSHLPESVEALPAPLLDRLGRGELFNLMRDYLAGGGTYQWHPLLVQTLTLIANLNDGSMLLQTQINFDPGENQRLEIGVVEPLGGSGDEFGGVPVVAGPDGARLTVGGGTRVYARWAYYF